MTYRSTSAPDEQDDPSCVCSRNGMLDLTRRDDRSGIGGGSSSTWKGSGHERASAASLSSATSGVVALEVGEMIRLAQVLAERLEPPLTGHTVPSSCLLIDDEIEMLASDVTQS